jgi:thymidine phosphorylase
LTWYTKKQKWTQLAKEILSSGEAYKKFLRYARPKAVLGNLNLLYKEDIKAEKSGVVTEIDNRRLAKIAKLAGAPHDSLKHPFTTSAKGRRVILYLFRNERRAEILDRLYEIRKEYYFNSKRMKIYFALPEMRT